MDDSGENVMLDFGRSPYSIIPPPSVPPPPAAPDGKTDKDGNHSTPVANGSPGAAATKSPPWLKRRHKAQVKRVPTTLDADPKMKRYPNAMQLADRFRVFDERISRIKVRHNRGDELTIEEGEALKFHDALLERLAFLRPGGTATGEPVARARIADPVVEKPPVSEKPPVTQGPSSVEYVGGARIKTDYSLREVIGMTANAAKSPFASFISSTRDLVKKATMGQALTADEEERIYRYAGVADAFASLTPQGNLMRVAGTALDGVNAVVGGEMPDPDKLRDDLLGTYKAFDFPLFKVRTGASADDGQAPHIIRKPAFKPPTRLPDGRTGYPLSPMDPPRLPGGTGDEPVAGPSGQQGATRTDTASTGTGSTKDSGRESEASSLSGLTSPADCTGCMPLLPKAKQAAVDSLARITGKGPISLTVPDSALADQARVERFGSQFFFYRRDRDVGSMDRAAPVRGTDYEERRDVLLVGDGSQASSQVYNSKIRAGAHWDGSPAARLEATELIELGNGRDGVGAIRLPFENIRRGSTVLVSGGAMNGCTMLFAADKESFYAYHAGTSDLSPNWLTAREGAQSIVSAHMKIGTKDRVKYDWHGTNDDLIIVGRQYPFSALVYGGRHLGNVNALVGAAAVLGAVGGAPETIPDANLNVPRDVSYTPQLGKRWRMVTFNYYEHDPNVRSVGTAEAVISKDLEGKVTVSVLAEKGKLVRSSSASSDRRNTVEYKYETMDSHIATVELPK
jgi:hypothetical protein